MNRRNLITAIALAPLMPLAAKAGDEVGLIEPDDLGIKPVIPERLRAWPRGHLLYNPALDCWAAGWNPGYAPPGSNWPNGWVPYDQMH